MSADAVDQSKAAQDYFRQRLHRQLVGEILYYIKDQGITRSEFAQEVGVSKGYISQFLNGKQNPTLKRLVTMAMKIGKVPHIGFTEIPKKGGTQGYQFVPSTTLLVMDDEPGYGTPNFLKGKALDRLLNSPRLKQLNSLFKEMDALRPFSEMRVHQMMQKFRFAWNYHSNAIEGNQLTYGETITLILHGLTAKGKPLKDHLDVKGHEDAVDLLLNMIKGERPLSQNDIRSLHKALLKDSYLQPSLGPDGYVFRRINVGEYKRQPNHVRRYNGTVHYYADPGDVTTRIQSLVDWYRRYQFNQQMHPLIVATILHHEFVTIHPFDDGNGRVGRILMNMVLMHHAYPPIVVPQHNRKPYYKALSMADSGDYLPLFDYLGDYLLQSLEIQRDGLMNGNINTHEWPDSE